MRQDQNPPRHLSGYHASAIFALIGVALKSESTRTMFARSSFTMGAAVYRRPQMGGQASRCRAYLSGGADSRAALVSNRTCTVWSNTALEKRTASGADGSPAMSARLVPMNRARPAR